MNSLLLSILAIQLAIFIVAPGRKGTENYSNLKLSIFLRHGLTVFGLLLLFLHGYQWLTLIGYALLLTLIHLVIVFQVGLLNRIKNRSLNLAVFIFEHLLQLVTIYIIWSWFDLQANPSVLRFYESIIPIKAFPSLGGLANQGVKPSLERFLLGAVFYIFICFGGSYLIEKFLFWLRNEEEVIEEKTDSAGKWIGILERIIVLTLMLNNALDSVAFILTAKSIARFNELRNKNFAEYYLIGTLASITLAICGGFLLKYLLTNI
ncbi:MAG: hypothetical protein GXY86_06215 [Firmicutes bacterium]|nr:hypothetical protein [Bacillota bacterium]